MALECKTKFILLKTLNVPQNIYIVEKSFLDKKIEETVKETIKEYREFAFKDDIKKVCAAVILGSSFDNLIKNISNNLFMPFFDFIINKTNGSWRDYSLEIIPGLCLKVGKVAGGLVDFAIISLILFVILRKIWIKEEKK